MRHGLTAVKEREVAAGNVAQYPEPWWEHIHVAQVLQEGKGVGGYALLSGVLIGAANVTVGHIAPYPGSENERIGAGFGTVGQWDCGTWRPGSGCRRYAGNEHIFHLLCNI